MTAPAAFSGFPPAALSFYAELEDHNSRDWWLAHKDVYERDVRAPMLALLDGLEEEFGEAKLFRPNRDVRFSADKSPYKTAIGATLAGGGYIQFSAAGLAAGRGMYMMAPDQLERYRRAVDTDPAGSEVVRLTDEARKASAQALRLGTRDARLLFHAGAIAFATGEAAEGRKLINEALALNPAFDMSGAAEAHALLASDSQPLARN